MATYDEIATGVRFRLGNRSDLTTTDGAILLSGWIHAAYLEICQTVAFDSIESETSSLIATQGQRYIDIPPGLNLYAVLSVYDTNNRVLVDPFPGTFSDYERRQTTNEGKPTYWTRRAGRIYLGPAAPDTAIVYRVLLYNEPAQMSSGDSPVIPATWHRGIIILATRNGWTDIGDEERASYISREEWPAYMSRVRTPKGIEASLSHRRGLRVRQYIRNRKVGV